MTNQQNILVTGSNSGFGFLTAKTLLQKGYTVFAAMRGRTGKYAEAITTLNRIDTEATGRLHPLELDVADTDSVNTAVEHALAKAGRIDVVVNNAGYGVGGFAETVTDAQFQRQFDVNVYGVHRIMRAVLPSMRKNNQGLFINISSVMGRIVIPFAATYTASKWALEGLSESYRYELAGTGVDVVLLEPGGFGTNFMTSMDHGSDTGRLEDYGELAQLPNKMWGGLSEQLKGDGAPNPQEIADGVLKLIQTPAGERPLRTVIDPLTGGEAAKALNQASDQIQRHMLEGMHMSQLLKLKS